MSARKARKPGRARRAAIARAHQGLLKYHAKRRAERARDGRSRTARGGSWPRRRDETAGRRRS